MRQIIIGREGNQPFPIADEYVSRTHAIFTYDERTGAMTLTNKSGSGTFVRMGNQFQQVDQCNVTATTDVRLGPFFTFRIGQLFQGGGVQQSVQPGPRPRPAQPQQPKPERVDIAYLRRVAETYETTKLALEQKQSNVNSLKTMSLVGSLAAGAVTSILPTMGGDEMKQYMWIGPVIAIVFLVCLMMYCSKASKDVIIKKNENEKNYKITFSCPKCHLPFAGKLYENILAEGKCPKCKSEFYDSQI